MTTLVKTQLHQPIAGRDDLVGYLAAGARPPMSWGIGAETEKIVVDRTTGEAAPYPRICQLLERLLAQGDWEPIREGEALLGLRGASASVTLEPGGQLELSGRICPSMACCQEELDEHTRLVVTAAADLDLAFLGLGAQPYSRLDQIALLPKVRYDIMYPYMARTGGMGQRMMKQSAGMQVNLDFSDEADAIAKLRCVQLLAPVLYALFANSPLLDGRPSGFLSSRGAIWADTDPDRTGLIDALHREDADFGTYVDYALDVPMYFIHREGRLIDLTGDRLTFRRFLAEGAQGQRAILADWDLHLSTLFPEVRLRPQIEVRCTDALPGPLTTGAATFLKGLLYDAATRDAACRLLWQRDRCERQRIFTDSWRLGLKTMAGNRSLQEVALDLLELAREGLAQQQRARLGQDERPFLDPVQEIAESGVTLAERLLAGWRGDRAHDLPLLLAHCEIR